MQAAGGGAIGKSDIPLRISSPHPAWSPVSFPRSPLKDTLLADGLEGPARVEG